MGSSEPQAKHNLEFSEEIRSGLNDYVSKVTLPGEFQGTESLWLSSKLSFVVVPSRDRAMGVIGASGMANLTDCSLHILKMNS